MQSEQDRIQKLVDTLSNHLARSGTSENPDPQQQRNAIQGVFATTVNNFNLFYQSAIEGGFSAKRLLTQKLNGLSDVAGLNNYQTEAMVFNTRFQAHPFAIALCETTLEVQFIYKLAIEYNLPIRVRSGGHDHEGECSGSNTILIDVSRIKQFCYDEKTEVATIGAGYRFYQLTPLLAAEGRMIAHGTCATVGLTGFIQGGGWGPWTRKYGMCCEYLVGATVVLGNGEVVEVSEACHSDILWALRGGGGMSWGIITELKVKTFVLPDEIHRFEIVWNQFMKPDPAIEVCVPLEDCPTIDILKAWEATIQSQKTANLLGTNLKINAIAKVSHSNINELYHPCTMFGYWEGTKEALDKYINDTFVNPMHGRPRVSTSKVGGKRLILSQNNKQQYDYDHALLSHWARESIADYNTLLHSILGRHQHAFTPDYDAPAPHKITSKLVKPEGLTQRGYEQLLSTLTSELVKSENSGLGLFSYVTLGAIVGDFYQQLDQNKSQLGVSFPYQHCLYTIQYQTWWNEELKNKVEQQNNAVYVDTNRAMDWISASRSADIEGAYGAFISFKDASIPTSEYFQQNYGTLVEIKKCYINDQYNHLRTRKTII
ncbi:FAD-binding oxidoreductase [Pseudoalteromonas sp. MMG013]|uniref:FAD-binding oxidoreductase n=1 Tax=Pseudoalteromonas sp. MMG013 TaxID=2822687 RepID=UPI001B390014|nr:FAD-binding oxidoreductase [Pseudoalteromonas sp. MMG013]MBQ4863990.1 FAD-binding oxidoreductase [Pseudoalteromonas sp. MMG013]